MKKRGRKSSKKRPVAAQPSKPVPTVFTKPVDIAAVRLPETPDAVAFRFDKPLPKDLKPEFVKVDDRTLWVKFTDGVSHLFGG